MKRIVSNVLVITFSLIVFSACADENPELRKKINPYINYLDKDHLSSKDYIFKLFEKYDVVILSERLRSESTQWDFITELISDERFAENVGNIFTEYGPLNYQNKIDSLLLNDNLSSSKAAELTVSLMRNLSYWPVLLNTGYFNLLNELHSKNLSLEKNQKIRLWFCDDTFNWDNVNEENYSSLFREYTAQKNIMLAERISSRYRRIVASADNRKKALVILYHANAFNKPMEFDNSSVREGTGAILARKYLGKTANVLINNTIDNLQGGRLKIADGLWDAAFAKTGNPDLGFDLNGSPFGNDEFDQTSYSKKMREKFLYKDIFTGYVFAGPLENHEVNYGYEGLLDGFEDEYLRRSKCIGEEYFKEIRENLIPKLQNEIVVVEKPVYAQTREDEIKYFLTHPVFFILVAFLGLTLYFLGKRYKR